MKLIDKEDYTNLDTDLKESDAVSNLMDDFPPICKEDPLDVRINFVLEHYQNTRETIKLDECNALVVNYLFLICLESFT